ncbi:MAG: hypothetical protein ACRDQA_29910 [Nocardioidaceae bacterium]
MPWPEKTQLFALPGTDPDKALLLGKGKDQSVYINEALAHREWPALIRAATGYPNCAHPVKFTGTWDSLGPNGMPRGGGYDVAVPYTGHFTAHMAKDCTWIHGTRFDVSTIRLAR